MTKLRPMTLSAPPRCLRLDAARPVPASGVLAFLRAAAPGRPKQGPTLSEGRSPYPASGVLQ